MPCSACAISALRCFFTRAETARTTRLRVYNVRYSTIEIPKNMLYISSSRLRNQPIYTSRMGVKQLVQVSDYHAALSQVEDPRRRKEPSHRQRNGPNIGFEGPTRIDGIRGGAEQSATTPAVLRLRRDSMKFAGFPKRQPSPASDAPLDQGWLKENMEGSRYGDDTKSVRPKNSIRHGRKARLRDSSKTAEWSKGAMRSSRSTTVSAAFRRDTQNHKDQREPWQTQKSALSKKFATTGWLPRKRLSPDTLEGIRALHAQYPDKFTTPVLADQFKVSPEAIRRILKSKWRPKDEEEESRRQRWEKRGENIWSQMVEIGIKPPKKWRDLGIGKSTESKPTRREQLEPQLKSKVTSRLGQSTSNLYTIPAKEHETGSPVPLSDRIL